MIMPMIPMTMIIDDTNVIMTMIMMQNKCGVESKTLLTIFMMIVVMIMIMNKMMY